MGRVGTGCLCVCRAGAWVHSGTSRVRCRVRRCEGWVGVRQVRSGWTIEVGVGLGVCWVGRW